MREPIHTFDNQIRVRREHLSQGQLERYRVHNVHEVQEERVFQDLIERAPIGATFLSVGMAIGYYVLLARRLRPDLEVHAAEPLARHRAWFVENAALNGLDPRTVHVHPEAVGPRAGAVAFQDDGFASVALVGDQRRGLGFWTRHSVKRGLTALGLTPERARIANVPMITLPTLLARIARPVALLQMDVQGVEGDILEASVATLRDGRVRHALIGTHSAAIHARSRAALEAAGFRVLVDEPDPGDQPDGMLVAEHSGALGRA